MPGASQRSFFLFFVLAVISFVYLFSCFCLMPSILEIQWYRLSHGKKSTSSLNRVEFEPLLMWCVCMSLLYHLEVVALCPVLQYSWQRLCPFHVLNGKKHGESNGKICMDVVSTRSATKLMKSWAASLQSVEQCWRHCCDLVVFAISNNHKFNNGNTR